MQSLIKPTIVLGIGAVTYLASIANFQLTDAKAYHGPQELNFFRGNNIELPLSDNGYFKASGNCDGCHGYDEQQEANVDGELNDISPVTMWRGTMMANAAKDPLWKAKVSHEVAVNPSHQEALEDKCTSCHAPLGRYSHVEFNLGPYGMDDLATDSLGMDGVSCLACHKQSTQDLGNLNSGNLNFAPQPVAFGPFEKPFEPPMQDLVGILPVPSNHIQDAGICAGCHSLLTESVDLQGNFTGQTFIEQATYHEWLNSSYNNGQPLASTCQECHMPEDDAAVILSANYSELFPREPFRRHELVGGNTFMLKLMRDNAASIGLAATDQVMDSTIARTERMLKNRTLNLDLSFATFDNDTGYFEVRLENLAGHKFPSGYPSRRAFVEFIVFESSGDTLFKSGVLQSDFEVEGHDAVYEPHYDVITSEDQVQIYEMIMGDVNGDRTTVLERAFTHLKDNRLTPKGFTTSHSVYDTTQIVGYALADADFNFDGFEGSGTDIIHYHIPLNGYNGNIKIRARVFYQVLPPRFLTELFGTSTPEISTFQTMYNNADKTPELVVADSILSINVVTGISDKDPIAFEAYPNPSSTGIVQLKGDHLENISSITIYDVEGRLLSQFSQYPIKGLELPTKPGIYLIRVNTENASNLLRVLRY
ncbi:MAG: T9SS type A sorting domain-containing protein [Flavobacteriales bacterium]|nr:T9SS type A sorting domain-containing protein [Flavobacteriales bacterium]